MKKIGGEQGYSGNDNRTFCKETDKKVSDPLFFINILFIFAAFSVPQMVDAAFAVEAVDGRVYAGLLKLKYRGKSDGFERIMTYRKAFTRRFVLGFWELRNFSIVVKTKQQWMSSSCVSRGKLYP